MTAGEFIKRQLRAFRASPMLMQIIVVNIAVFVLLRLAAITGIFSGADGIAPMLLGWLELPSDPASFIMRPWTALTYMFTQYDVMHILFNMLWLYWFGTLFNMVATPRQLLALYILGGLGGAVFFMAGYNIFPFLAHHRGMLLGSSASVLAIVTATVCLMPDFRMNLLFIGSVKIKWIALATYALVILGVTGANAGGNLAHLGGVAVGALWAIRLKQGSDFTVPLCRLLDRLANIRKIGRASHPSQSARPANARPGISDSDRATLDIILEKIKKSGYAALTPAEKKLLFDISRNIK